MWNTSACSSPDQTPKSICPDQCRMPGDTNIIIHDHHIATYCTTLPISATIMLAIFTYLNIPHVHSPATARHVHFQML